ncbi:MAG: dTDP-glucose 4,6-dehydratase, partial [Candidatus Caldatribacterium sp.]|nr:dTDP-glucose 4,6-dehydratase [Candidatus Caldatribacterium sp.]
MKLLVTGGCGFIGSNFIRYVLKVHPDWEIVNLDKLTYAGNLKNLKDVEGNPRYRFVKGDIADRNLVHALFAEEKFTAVVNFAAESHVDRSILDPAPFIETNVKGTQVLLEAARAHGVEKFLQISTDEVYGSLDPDDPPFSEESPLRPNSPYAASKASADLLCRAYYKAYGVPVAITRSSNNYGPYQFPEKLIPLMIRNALQGMPLPVYGRGENIRDWLYVEDNCKAIDLVLQRGRAGEIYNIGGGCEKKNLEVVQMICNILEELNPPALHRPLHSLITFIRDPRGAAHDLRYALDCRKIKEELGWEPKVSFEEGLRRTVEWYLDNGDWVESVITGEYLEYYQKVYG